MKTSIYSANNFTKTLLATFFFFLVNVIHAQEISINQRSHIVLNGNVSLVVNNAAFINNGNVSTGTGTVKFTGYNDTTGSYIGGSNSTSFYNLTVDKAAYGTVLKSGADIINTLTVSTGTLYTDSNLTLKSDAAFTARLAPVGAAAYITGKANIERYIPARRAWRMLTAPLTDAGSIFNTWQNSGVYQPGLNTFVTGPNATGANGLDASPQNNVSMKTWNSATQQFNNVTNTKVAISAGNNGSADNTAYFIFVRGDRDQANFSTATCNATTLTSNGRLQTGTQVFNVAGAPGAYTMVGNPYASPIDFSTLTKTNLVNRFYVWDPSLNMLGGYVMLDDLSNSGTYNKTVTGSSQTKDIQSGQAFLVQTKNNAAASLTFNEANKSSVNNNLMFRPASGSSQFLRINLNIVTADSSLLLADGIFAEYNDNFSEAVNQDDAAKFTNINENICFVRNGSGLAAERRPFISEIDTLFLKLWKTTPNKYQFDIVPADFAGTNIFVEDTYLDTTVPVNEFGTTAYNFTIDGNAASAHVNRFRIILKKYNVLPVTVSSVSAVLQNNNVAVEWKVENELNITKYEVQKSVTGSDFSTTGVVAATGNNNLHNTYNWTDVTAAQGTNFYRIKIYDRSGVTKYSSIVKVVTGKTVTSSMGIYPNPVTNNIINLELGNQPKGIYKMRLTNTIGQVLYSSSMNSNSGNGTLLINVPVKMSPGIYQLEVITPENKTAVETVVAE